MSQRAFLRACSDKPAMDTLINLPSEQVVTVGQALLTGVIMGIYYDIFRIIRRIFTCRYATIVAQDLFFWVTSAVVVFFVCIWCTGGHLRVIFVLAVLIGWGAYAASIGAMLMVAVDWGVVYIKRVGHYMLCMTKKAFTEIIKKDKKVAK